VIRTVRLGTGEAWRNRRINLALGLILSIGIIAQLWAVMTANVSETALARYNLEHYGEAQTWAIQADREGTVAQLIGLQEYLTRRRAEQPALRMAATGNMSVKVTDGSRTEPFEAGILAMDPAWTLVSRAPIDSELFAVAESGIVTVEWSRPPSGMRARCLAISADPAADPPASGVTGAPPASLCRLGYRHEPNDSFTADGYAAAGPALEAIPGAIAVQVTYVCDRTTVDHCTAVARQALADAGLPTRAQPQRIDKSTRLLPVLQQRARDNRRAANLVAVVAAAGVGLAATIAATGRARRYTLYRCLGATRARVGWISATEALALTGLCAAVCTAALIAVMQAAPGVFSSLDGITPEPAPPSPAEIKWLAIKLVALGLATAIPAAIAAAASRLSLE
jgi:hypothetical protein